MGFFKDVRDFYRYRKAKHKQNGKRAFAGAKGGRLVDFMAGAKSADEEIRYDIRRLRDRCRDLARNNDYAKRFISIMKTNVIGEMGIQLQADAKERVRGEIVEDDNANDIIESEWAEWSEVGNCTVDGKLSFLDCQDLIVESLAVEGEVLIQLVKNGNYPWGFALKFLDNDMLDEQYNEKLSNGNEIRMGVEVNSDDKPVAYWLWDYNPNDALVQNPSHRKRRRVPADQILHFFRIGRAGQNRGIPPMAAAILDLKHLDGYVESELVAARVASAKMAFITSEKGDQYEGEDNEDEYTPLSSAEPGHFEQLPEGMSITPFDLQHPTSQFPAFIKQILRGIASGTGVSYANLSNDLESVNYSSIRQGALEERNFFKKEQRFLIQHFFQRVYRTWLLMAMTTGKVPLPVRKFDKFAKPKWLPRGFGYIDPLKEVQSYKIAVENGFMTLQDVANIQGKDVKTIFEAMKKEKQLAEKFGIEWPISQESVVMVSEDTEQGEGNEGQN